MVKLICELLGRLETVSEANRSGEHWTSKRKRHVNQQLEVKALFMDYGKTIPLPCHVVFTRLSPRLLDSDNLVSAFKWIRDQAAECILLPHTHSISLRSTYGRYDDDPRIQWEYNQEKSKLKGFKIKIYKNEPV